MSFSGFEQLIWDLWLVQHRKQAQQDINLWCCLVTLPGAVWLIMNWLSGHLQDQGDFLGSKIYFLAQTNLGRKLKWMFHLHKVFSSPFSLAEEQDHMFSQWMKVGPVKWGRWTEGDVNLYWDCICSVILRVSWGWDGQVWAYRESITKIV